MKTKYIIILVTLVLPTWGCYATPQEQPPQMLAAVPPLSSHPSRIGPADVYPPAWATGAINQDITQRNISENICNPHWSTKSERPPARYTTALKIEQLKQLGYGDQSTADYEEDHLISLELGGNPTDSSNLWPEPYNA